MKVNQNLLLPYHSVCKKPICHVLGRRELPDGLYVNSIGRRRCGRRGERWLERLTLGYHRCRAVGLLGILAWSEGLLRILALGVLALGILALGRVSTRGDTARGIVAGLTSSITGLGEVGGEVGAGRHKRIINAAGLGDEGNDKKSDPVEEKDKPAEPRKGLEGLILLAEACSGGWN